jgi:Ca2+:H+ antiporter
VLVLLPEGLAAIKAARRNALQTSLNIALGSALATIGLTIPAVVVVALVSGRAMTLGLEARDMMMLLLVLAISIISFGTGRTNILFGAVHLVVFAAYILFLFAP